LAPCPDAQQDERAAECLNRLQSFAEHDGRNDNSKERHQTPTIGTAVKYKTFARLLEPRVAKTTPKMATGGGAARPTNCPVASVVTSSATPPKIMLHAVQAIAPTRGMTRAPANR
jgi:hypothetical protein